MVRPVSLEGISEYPTLRLDYIKTDSYSDYSKSFSISGEAMVTPLTFECDYRTIGIAQ